MSRFKGIPLRWRGRLIPEEYGPGWMPFYMLGYLVFLFMPMLFDYTGKAGGKGWSALLWPTLASIAVFLPLYFTAYRTRGARQLACTLAIAALGYALLPINPFSNTYIIYAVSFAAMLGNRLLARVALLVAVLALFLVEILLLRYPVFVFAITTLIGVAVFFGNHVYAENARKGAALKLSHDEVRRLAALAERERIGRDLHDLLGHTLSLVALKSELAGKLFERDPHAARREIDEVARVARDALSQVRRAVTGIRAAGLAAELASAKLLLESSDVGFRYALGDNGLPPEVETVLALTVREAVTNIQRHARARQATVMLDVREGTAVLRIDDDGRGGSITPGNGLKGMCERIEALGGTLRIDSASAKGTHIEVWVPLAAGEDTAHARRDVLQASPS